MKSLEKHRIFWTLITGVVISLVIVIGTMTNMEQSEKTQAQNAAPEASETVSAAGYVMRIDDGQIALFRSGSTTPYERLDMPLNLLSDYDLTRLEAGIEVETQQEMQRLIEDFTS